MFSTRTSVIANRMGIACAVVLMAALVASSCGFRLKAYENPITKDTQQPDKVLYDKAVKDIEHGRYETARLTLNTLINTYDSSEFLAKAKLAIADSWFRQAGAEGYAIYRSVYDPAPDRALGLPVGEVLGADRASFEDRLNLEPKRYWYSVVVMGAAHAEQDPYASFVVDVTRAVSPEEAESRGWVRDAAAVRLDLHADGGPAQLGMGRGRTVRRLQSRGASDRGRQLDDPCVVYLAQLRHAGVQPHGRRQAALPGAFACPQ